MSDTELERFAAEFGETAGDARRSLSGMLNALDEERAPSPESLVELDAAVRALQEKYHAIYSLTKSIVAADELPEEGAPVGQCLQAVRNSRMQRVREDLDGAVSLLRRFCGVRSRIPEYAEALAPYQREAAGLLEEAEGLSGEAALGLLADAAKRHVPFLKLLKGGDISADITLLETLDSIYSKRVQLGLAAKLYFLPKEEIAEKPSEPAVRSGAQAEEEMFYALSKIKKSVPKAKAFEKDLKDGYHRGYDKLPLILPLFTHFGVMTAPQVYAFSFVFDYVDKLEMSQDEVVRTLDWLVEKSCLVAYDCSSPKNKNATAYCLTHYGLSCMYKESIAPVGRSHKRWRIPYGRRKLYGGEKIEQSVVYDAVYFNELLLTYLQGQRRNLTNSGEYADIVESVTWKDGYFSVNVRWRGRNYVCQVGSKPTDFVPAFEANFLCVDLGLWPLDQGFIEEHRCFVFSDGHLSRGKLPRKSGTRTKKKVLEEPEAEKAALPEPEPTPEPAPIPEAEGALAEALKAANAPEVCRLLLEERRSPSDALMSDLILALLRSARAEEGEIPNRSIVRALLLAKGAALSPEYPECGRLFAQLLLATRVPAGEFSGTGADLAAAFPGVPLESAPLPPGVEAMTLSAYLYGAAFPTHPYDEALQTAITGLLEDYGRAFPSYPEVKPLFHKLCDALDAVPEGFSNEVLRLLRGEAETGAIAEALRAEAAPLAGEPAIKVQMRIMPKFLKVCFGPESEIARCMEAVLKDNRAERERARQLLTRYCGRDGALSLDRIEEVLDEYWAETRKSQPGLQAPPQFLHRARRDVVRAFQQRLSVLQRWTALDDPGTQRHDPTQLRALRDEALERLKEALTSLEGREGYARLVVLALEGIRDRLMGAKPPVLPFADLLTTGILSLDEEGRPIMEATHCGVRYYEPWRNMLRHIAAPERTLAQAREEIGTRSGSPMFDNFRQLEMIGRFLGEDPRDYAVSEQDLQSARRTAEDATQALMESLELDQLHGRVTRPQKRGLTELIEANRERFFAIQDFGCWGQFLGALRAQAEDFAALSLEANPQPEPREDEAPRAEAPRAGLSAFLSDPVFTPLYQECDNPSHRKLSLRSFGRDYLEKAMPEGWAPRVREEAKAFLANWPWRGTITVSQIEKFCAGLGFAVRENEGRKRVGQGLDLYEVRVSPSSPGLSAFPHPVAEFGTRMRPELFVTVLNGFHPAEAIVEAVTAQALDSPLLLLMDYHMDRLQRAQVAEAFYAQGGRPFLLIDRVLALHLALCQREERSALLLQCTLPYMALQPFRAEGPTPPEMFMGRDGELEAILDREGPCLLYGWPKSGKSALLERAASLCDPSAKSFAVLRDIGGCDREEDVAQSLADGLEAAGLSVPVLSSLKDLCAHLQELFKRKRLASLLLMLDNADAFLEAAGAWEYASLSPLFALRRETGNSFKFVLSVRHVLGLQGIRDQLGALCLKPLPPDGATRLLLEPLNYLGYGLQGPGGPLEAILSSTGRYPGLVQWAGHALVQGLMDQHNRYYRALDGHPPFPLQDEQIGGVLRAAGLNEGIRQGLAALLRAEPRGFMLALCVAWLHYSEEAQERGFSVHQILEVGVSLHRLKGQPCEALLEEMADMGILIRPEPGRYRLAPGPLLDALGDSGDQVLDELFLADGAEADDGSR